DGDYCGIARELGNIEACFAAIGPCDQDARRGIGSAMPESAAAEAEEARVFVEEAGENRLGDIAAYDLIAEGSCIVLGEAGEAAVVVEPARRDLGLQSEARQ